MRDDLQLRQVRRDLRKLLPADKSDVDAVPSLVALGYPSVEPILFDLLKWIRQPDWPVCKPIAAFLAKIGVPLTPHLEQLFRTHDEGWTAQVIREILEHWPREAILPLVNYVSQRAIHGHWGHDLEALEFLVRHRLVDSKWALELLASKRRFHGVQLSRIESIAELLSDQDPAV